MDAKDLAAIPLFETLSRHDLERVARWADDVTLPAGRHLLDQGSFPHEFFVLLEGEAEVRKDDELLATLGPGDFFGELAILGDDRRTATVVAATPVRVAVMTPRDFDQMRAQMPDVADRIQQAAADRMPR